MLEDSYIISAKIEVHEFNGEFVSSLTILEDPAKDLDRNDIYALLDGIIFAKQQIEKLLDRL